MAGEARYSAEEVQLMKLRGILERWGEWVLQGRPGPGVYRCPLGNLRGGGLPIAPIADDDALTVDAAYGALKAWDANQARAIELWYVRRLESLEKLGKAMRIPRYHARHQARMFLLSGENFLAGRLAELLARR